MRFETTAWPRNTGACASSVIPKGEYHTNGLNFWPYQNESELERALTEFAEIIEKYGLDELTKLSAEDDKIIPTVEMGEKLFANYKLLNEQFITQNQIDIADTSKNGMSKWFDIIEAKMTETKNLPYEQVQDMLVEIAAFLGVQLEKGVEGEWIKNEDPRGVWVKIAKANILRVYWPLTSAIDAWKYQRFDYLKENHFISLESGLPMTVEQMVSFQDRLDQHFEKGFKIRTDWAAAQQPTQNP